MYKYTFYTIEDKFFFHDFDPLSIFSILRKQFINSFLLESFFKEYSIIGINPIYEICIKEEKATIIPPYGEKINKNIQYSSDELVLLLENIIDQLEYENYSHDYSGFYGHFSYESLQYFEQIKLNKFKENDPVKDIYLAFYSNLILFNHKDQSITLIEHVFKENHSLIKKIKNTIYSTKKASFDPFILTSSYYPNALKDKLAHYHKMFKKAQESCFKGDVFQIVISLCFEETIKGDLLHIYKAMRELNPLSFLFYFDYTSHKILGASPENQLTIYNKKAYLEPIAGTVARKDDDKENEKIIKDFLENKKENAEHTMLVDLARNDLSKNCIDIQVEDYKKVKSFPYLFHMSSIISGKLKKTSSSIKTFLDSFPSGTLTGAPKYKAIELIDKIEGKKRRTYGGAIGFFGLNGNLSTVILIRSLLGIDNKIFFQAGGGITIQSDEKRELEEIRTKLNFLYKAIKKAQENPTNYE